MEQCNNNAFLYSWNRHWQHLPIYLYFPRYWPLGFSAQHKEYSSQTHINPHSNNFNRPSGYFYIAPQKPQTRKENAMQNETTKSTATGNTFSKKIGRANRRIAKKRTEEFDKQKQEEKDEREKRQKKRGEILEKLIPETVNLTIEQFTTLIYRTTANPFGRDKLAEILKENGAKPKPQSLPAPTSPTNEKPTPQTPPSEKPNPPTNADDGKN